MDSFGFLWPNGLENFISIRRAVLAERGTGCADGFGAAVEHADHNAAPGVACHTP